MQKKPSEWMLNGDAYNTRGLAKYGLGRFEEAIQDANEALRLNPENGWAYNTRGLGKNGAGKYEEAVQDASEAIRRNPKSGWAYYTRGLAEYGAGKFDATIQDANEAIRLDPNNGWGYYYRGLGKYGLGKYDEALLDCNEAVRLDPKNGWAFYLRGIANSGLRKYELAIQDLNEAIRLINYGWAYYQRGFANYGVGKFEEAIRDLDEALRMDPKNGWAFYLRGVAKSGLSKYELAIQDYKEGVRLNGGGSKESKEALEKLQNQLSAAASKPIRKVALVIGVKSYTAVAPLSNTINDAMDVSASLRSKGFEVIEVLDPQTKYDLRNAAIKFSKMLEDNPEGVGMLYYSGHGMQLDGVNYLIPATATLDIKADVEEQCLNMDYFLRTMEANGNHLNIVVLDACRNNPFRSFSRSAEKGLSMVSAPKGSYIVYATKPGSVASDGNGRNGLFTSKLLKFLAEPNLNIEQVFKKVAAEVAHDSNDSQRPWIASDYTGDFYFTVKNK